MPVLQRRGSAIGIAQLASERKRQASEQAVRARARYLDELARRKPGACQEIEVVFDSPLVSHAKGAAYEQKAKLLHDLRDLAIRKGQVGEGAFPRGPRQMGQFARSAKASITVSGGAGSWESESMHQS